MNELVSNSGVVLVNNDAPQLPSHDALVQELQTTLSMKLQNRSTSAANIRETSTSSTSGAINSTSTNTTVVADIEDSGIMEEPVFLETETKSDVKAKSSQSLNQPSRSCVTTCGRGSHECTMTTTAGQSMNLIPYQKNGDPITESGYPNNHSINHREPEADSSGYMNITRQAIVHTTEHSSTMQYSLSQPLLTDCNQSPTYVNHTEIPFCQCHVCCKGDNPGHDCVNEPTLSSLSQPLLNDNDGSERGFLYVNHTRVQSSSQLNPSMVSSSFKRQISAPVYAVGADEQASTNHHIQNDGNDLIHGYVNILKSSENISLLEHQKSGNGSLREPAPSRHHGQTKSPSQSRSLLPRTQLPTTSHCQSSQEASSAQRTNDYYEDASSWPARMSKQTILTPTETVVCVSRSQSGKSCSSTTGDRGYINITKPRSISQPTPVTADMFNPALIPPRTIPRANFHQTTASNDKSLSTSSVHTVPPRPRSKTTQHIHTLSATLLPAKDLQLVQSTETESKSSSGCSSGSSDQLDCSTIEGQKRHTHDKHISKNSSRSTCRERGCSCDLVGDASYVVDGLENSKMSESTGESLDMWPPVIPRRTELMFIVAHNQPEYHDQKDLGGDLQDDDNMDTDNNLKSMKMTVNTSYVKR